MTKLKLLTTELKKSMMYTVNLVVRRENDLIKKLMR